MMSWRRSTLGIAAFTLASSACAFLSSPTLSARPGTATASANRPQQKQQQQQQRRRQLRMASAADELAAPKQRAVVVGGGPAGALMAVYLSRSGRFEVDVFEAFEESEISGPTVRSWNVVLLDRGIDALETAGFNLQEEAGESVIPLTGTVRHHEGRKVTPQFAGTPSICRGNLAKSMLNHASRLPNINVHYGCAFSKVDMGRSAATFERGDGDTMEREYDMLVGADGVNSRVRKSLEENVPDFTVRQEKDELEFKTISFPVMGMEGADESWKTRFHTCIAKIGSMVGSATPYGDMTCAVILREEGESKSTFDAVMKTTKDVRDFFGTHFPFSFGPEGPSEEVAKDFLERRPQRLVSTYCSSLSHGNIVLIGDSAHSMYASLGQGVNSALEDCKVFAQVLESAAEGKASDQAGVDVPAVLAAYNARRLEDALAVVKLSAQRMGGYRLPSIRFVGTMMVTMGLHKTLGRLAPKVFAKPTLFEVAGTDMSYGEVWREGKREAAVASALLFSTVAIVATIAARVFRRSLVV